MEEIQEQLDKQETLLAALTMMIESVTDNQDDELKLYWLNVNENHIVTLLAMMNDLNKETREMVEVKTIEEFKKSRFPLNDQVNREND
jgi:hypothetical protein